MKTFLFQLTNNLFFPLTLAGSVWFLDYLGVSDHLGGNRPSYSAHKYRRKKILFSLFSFLVGLWASSLLYLSFVGVVHLGTYPLPGLDVILAIYSICMVLNFGALGANPVLLFTPLLGLIETFVGLLAHSGVLHLANQEAELLNQLPYPIITFIGIFLALGIRSTFYIFKGV